MKVSDDQARRRSVRACDHERREWRRSSWREPIRCTDTLANLEACTGFDFEAEHFGCPAKCNKPKQWSEAWESRGNHGIVFVLGPRGVYSGDSVSKCMNKSKLRNHLERSRRSVGGFSNLVDECRRSVAEESRALANVHDSAGSESHQTRTGCIRSYRIVRKHNHSQRTRRAVKGTVPFHRHYAVCDHEVDRNGCAQIEDALLNALPMENILRPSVSRARYYAEHVLHSKSDAGPVVGLDLGHGNQEIRFQHSPREPRSRIPV